MSNSINCRNLSSGIQFTYPSISQMSEDQINSFNKVDGWVQSRTLFDDPCFPCSWSGGKTEEGLNLYNMAATCYCNEFIIADADVFRKIMSDLKSDDIYLDIGAGDGHAIHQYREMHPDGATAIGVALTQPRHIERVIEAEKKDEKFAFFLCDFKEFPIEPLAGRTSVITDIKGAFRYGLDPAGVIKKMGALLKEGGIAIIALGYGLGINPPSQIKSFVSKKRGSLTLLHLWFHTIKGFDVLKQQKSFEESLKINNELLETPKEMKYFQDYAYGNELIVLRRNSQPVEAEELIPSPEFVNTWSKLEDSEKNYDCFWPKYTWKTSDASETLLSKIKEVNL